MMAQLPQPEGTHSTSQARTPDVETALRRAYDLFQNRHPVWVAGGFNEVMLFEGSNIALGPILATPTAAHGRTPGSALERPLTDGFAGQNCQTYIGRSTDCRGFFKAVVSGVTW